MHYFSAIHHIATPANYSTNDNHTTLLLSAGLLVNGLPPMDASLTPATA